MSDKKKDLKTLYQALEEVKTEAKKVYMDGKIRIDRTELEKRIAQSRHLVDFADLKIDKNWLEGLFSKYVMTLRTFSGCREIANELEQAVGRKELDLETLVKRVSCSDSDYLETLAEKLSLKTEDLVHLGLRLGTPVFELYAAKLRAEIDPDKWLKGHCPVCGSSPAMAYLRYDDGKRILWCQFCGTEWSFLRLKCPFCSNDDHETLRYFFADEIDAYRVYVCDKCKKYVKTIDQRKLSDYQNMDLGWEHLQSLDLDMLAQKDGYSALPARVRA